MRSNAYSPANARDLALRGLPRDECGVCAVVGSPDAPRLVFAGLMALRHRGQESAGIVSMARGASGQLEREALRGMGRVEEALSERAVASMRGHVAVGHARYSTSGAATPANTPPLAIDSRYGPLALSHNGNLVNATALRAELANGGARFDTTVDSETLLRLLEASEERDFESALIQSLGRLEGAYSFALSRGETLYAIRDPRGFRPLVLGRIADGGWVVASETIALDAMGARFERDVEPGEVLRLEADRATPERLSTPTSLAQARCVFELIYFASAASLVDGRDARDFRERAGRALWAEQPADADFVAGVPESALDAARGYALAAGLPLVPAIRRSGGATRSFLQPTDRLRRASARDKHRVDAPLVAGKRVVVVDDSIVRGVTSRVVANALREAGAREVHLRVASPPWRHPCFYGIDAPDPVELAAGARSVEELRAAIGCDSLAFLSVEALASAARETDGWCDACFTGRYPTARPSPFELEAPDSDRVAFDPSKRAERAVDSEPIAAGCGATHVG